MRPAYRCTRLYVLVNAVHRGGKRPRRGLSPKYGGEYGVGNERAKPINPSLNPMLAEVR